MEPYFAIVLVVILLAFVSDGLNRAFAARRLSQRPLVTSPIRRWGPLDLAVAAVLVGFAGSRLNVGTDYSVYYAVYARMAPDTWRDYLTSPQEVGFASLMVATKQFSSSPYGIFWVASLVSIVPALVALRQRAHWPALALALYVLLGPYLGPFNVLRQGMAVAVLFWGAGFLKRRPWLFVVAGVAAASLHVSAAIAALVMVGCVRWRPTPRSISLVLAAGLPVTVALANISIVRGWLTALNPRYDQYVEGSGSGVGAYLTVFAYLALIVYALSLKPRLVRNGSDEPMFTALSVFGVAFMIVGTQSVVLARMSMYFTIFIVLLVANRVSASKAPHLHAVVVMAAALVFFAMYLANYGGLIPYSSTMVT